MKAIWKRLLMSLDNSVVSLLCQESMTLNGSGSASSSSCPVMFSKTTHVCKVLHIQAVKGDAEEMCHEEHLSRVSLDLSQIFTFFSTS